jgi:hypothetical protein
VVQQLRLQSYFQCPGDGRIRPQIPAQALLWGIVLGHVLRDSAFHAIDALVHSPVRVALGVSTAFSDDTLGYFTERLAVTPTRGAMASTVRRAKRHKAFAQSPWIGLVLDGTTVAHCTAWGCAWCRPLRNADHEIIGYRHHLVMISVAGTGLSLPFDVEPYGPGESEYAAGHRVLKRAVANVGGRFADYVVVDGDFAKAPFLHVAGDLGLRVVARVKDHLPELYEAAHRRYVAQPPTVIFEEGKDRVEVWDAEDFDPWEALRWKTVRVLYYRQHKPTGEVIEACWLTDFPAREVGSRALYRMAKSRWEIENQGFNDAKRRYGMEHMCHHDANSLLVGWLLTSMALSIERLYRLRYLHRGTHAIRTAIELVRLLWFSLGRPQRRSLSRPPIADTS